MFLSGGLFRVSKKHKNYNYSIITGKRLYIEPSCEIIINNRNWIELVLFPFQILEPDRGNTFRNGEMEELRKKRSLAKSQFTRTEKSLRKLLDDEQSLEELISKRFNEMSQKWQEIQDAHDLYMQEVPEEEV